MVTVGTSSFGKRLSPFAAAALAFAVFSCGPESDEKGSNGTGGSGGSGGSAGGAVSSTDYPQRFAETHCETIGSCCNRESFPFDQATCIETLEGSLRPGFGSILENPNIAFDGAAAARCLEAYRAALTACDDRDLAQRIDQPCEEVFHGVVPEGGQCEGDDECTQGSTGTVLCDDDGVCRSAEDEIPPGNSSRAGLGQACSVSCSEGISWSWCGVSVPGATAGASCYAEDGLYCSAAAVCEPAPGVGELCPMGACDESSYCLGGSCVARTDSAACDVGYECLPTSECDFDTGACVPNKMNGAACTSATECQSVHCAAGTCRDWSLATPETCEGTALAGAY